MHVGGGPGRDVGTCWSSGWPVSRSSPLSYIPLAIHELTNDFSELHAALDYIAGGGDPATMGPIGRLLVVAIRVVAWPLVGLITDAPVASVLALILVVAIVVWRWRSTDPPGERTAVRWLGLGLAWTALALTFAAPGLAVVVAGLPNDHYHAFADPMVFVLIGLGAGAAASLRAAAGPSGSPALRQAVVRRRGRGGGPDRLEHRPPPAGGGP